MIDSASQPEHRIASSFATQAMMATLGAELVHVAEGEVHIALHPRPELSQQYGYTHGGAIASIADSACGYAALTVAPPDHEVLTIEFKINFLRPAVGARFVAVGKVQKAGRTVTVCHGEVFAEQDDTRRKSIALIQATIMTVAQPPHG